MSRRFPHQMICPDCELLVFGNRHTGMLRAHRRQAIDAGRPHAACVKRERLVRNFRRGG